LGWSVYGEEEGLPAEEITALGLNPHGLIWAGFPSGRLAVYVREDHGGTVIVSSPTPAGSGPVRAIFCDTLGRGWGVFGEAIAVSDAPPGAWQKNWKETGRLPGSNHDLCGDELDGKFYMAGGTTSEFGFPASTHFFDRIFCYDPVRELWTVAARLVRSRVYNGLVAFHGKIWIIGGDICTPEGRRLPSETVEVFDPATGKVEFGPSLLKGQPMPVALRLGERIYVAGSPKGEGQGLLESIGHGEVQWRAEPDMPLSMGPSAAAALEGRFYLSLPGRGLLAYDPSQKKWNVDFPAPPHIPRSPQMAAFGGEIWMMGGRGIPDEHEVTRFSPGKAEWHPGPRLPRELAWGAGGVVSGKLIVAGGASGRCFSDRTFLLRPSFKAPHAPKS
jgi:hypothetical protein